MPIYTAAMLSFKGPVTQITKKCNEGKLPLDKEIKDYMFEISEQILRCCLGLKVHSVSIVELKDIQDYIDLEKWGDMYVGLLRRESGNIPWCVEYDDEDINRNIPAAFILTVED